MAQTEDFLDDRNRMSPEGRSSREIRSEIDRTRADMDETFAALDSKLTPAEIGREVWHAFKGGSSAGAGKVWRIAREHPMPSAVIGLGLGWLLLESSKRGDGRAFETGSYRAGYVQDWSDDPAEDEGHFSSAKAKLSSVAESAKDAAGWTQEQAAQLGHRAESQARALKGQARHQARRVKKGFRQTLEESPLVVGAATLAAGLVAGLLIPETEKESELMGETRDHLVEEVKEAGRQALDKGKHVAEAVADKVKEEVQNQGLTPEGMADKVRGVARAAASTAKEEARNQNLTTPENPSAVGDREPALANR